MKKDFRGESILWLLTLTLPIFTGLVLGSRQYLVGVMMFVVLTSLFRSRNIGGLIGRSIKYAVVLAIILVPGFFIYLVRGIVLDRYFYTLKQLEYGSSRLELWREIIADISSENIFGKGVGYTYNLVGHHADNFYIEFILDYGILSFGLLIFMTMAILLIHLVIIRKYQLIRMELGMWLVVFISFVWFAQFNEIVREHALWLVFGALISRNRFIIHSFLNRTFNNKYSPLPPKIG